MKKLQALTSHYPHLYLYIKEDSLFVWSIPKKALYGFEGVSGAVFLYMEELSSSLKEDDVYNYFHTVPKEKLQPLVEQILTILKDITPLTNTQLQEQNTQQKKLSLEHSFYKSFTFKLNDEYFTLEVQDSTTQRLVFPSLQHLHNMTDRSDFRISVVNSDDGGYEIYVDGVLYDSVAKEENLVPVLYDRIRIYYYQKNPFLVALHAAILKYNDRVVIFPGISGAGKSTLSAYLMYQEFTLFSDELTIIDENKTIIPVPLGVTLKEGSWHVMEPFVKDMNLIASHLRFDGQKIKFIIPPKKEYDKFKAKKLVFIFPKFEQGSPTRLQPLSLVSVLNTLIDAGYHLCDPNDFEKVFLWLEILSEAKLYALQYSNIDEAHSIIKEVL